MACLRAGYTAIQSCLYSPKNRYPGTMVVSANASRWARAEHPITVNTGEKMSDPRIRRFVPVWRDELDSKTVGSLTSRSSIDSQKHTKRYRMTDLFLVYVFSNHAFFHVDIGMFCVRMFLNLLEHFLFGYSFRSKVTPLDYTAKLSWHTAC